MQDEAKQVREGLLRLFRAPFLEEPKIPRVQSFVDELAIRADDVIVELGAGGGHFTLPIARELETLGGRGIVFACDFSKSLVQTLEQTAIAERVDEHVRAFCLDEIGSQTLPFEDERVDIVLAVNFLQYLPDPVSYLKEIARILTPIGSLVIADWQKRPKTSTVEPGARGIAPDELFPMVTSAGLEVIFQLELDGHEWALRVIKPIVFYA